jgi:hypothetical protein
MIISRSVSTSVADAIETTFDGQHPCPMCSAIADAKQSERQSELSFDLQKKVGDLKFLVLDSEDFAQACTPRPLVWPFSVFDFLTRAEAPPTPPPLA